MKEATYIVSVDVSETIKQMPLNESRIFKAKKVSTQKVVNAVSYLRKKGYSISCTHHGVEGMIVTVTKSPKRS